MEHGISLCHADGVVLTDVRVLHEPNVEPPKTAHIISYDICICICTD